MKYRAEIDGLRALAILPVVLFHAGIPGFSGGFIGVDVFFVVSGYLITGILRSEKVLSGGQLLRFYERRVRRLLPALYLTMLASVPMAWWLLLPRDLVDYSQSLLAVLGFGSNILFWLESGYFDNATELKPLLHTWSLAVEEQFYLLYPLFIIWASRWTQRHLLVLLGVGAIAGCIFAQWAGVKHPQAAFYLLPARSWELLAGAWLAVYVERFGLPRVASAAQLFAGLSGLGMVLVPVGLFDATTVVPGFALAIPVGGTALLILFAHRATLIGRLLRSWILVAVGLMSYSLYLWHQPILAFYNYTHPDEPTVVERVVLLTLCVSVAYVSWRWVEQPFRHSSMVSLRATAGVLLGTAVLLGSLGLAGWKSEGAPERFSGAFKEALASIETSPRREDCHSSDVSYLAPADACAYNESPTRWAVLGDSHAVELTYALAQQLEGMGAGVRQFSFSNCLPGSRGVSAGSACERWFEDALDQVSSTSAIENVVLAFRLNFHLYGEHLDDYPSLVDEFDAVYRDELWTGLAEIVSAFQAHGKEVYLVLQAPELPAHVQRVLGGARFQQADIDVPGVSRDWWLQRNAYVEQALSRMPSSTHVIDPADSYCDDRWCYAVRNNRVLYFDADHPSVAGAEFIAASILEAAKRRRKSGEGQTD